MLVWTNRGRRSVVATFVIVVLVLLIAPLLVVIVASLARSWNSVLPSSLTLAHVREALDPGSLDGLSTSVRTALLAGFVATLTGTWAALTASSFRARCARPQTHFSTCRSPSPASSSVSACS